MTTPLETETPWAYIVSDELDVIELGIRVVMCWNIHNSPFITIYHRPLAEQDWDNWMESIP